LQRIKAHHDRADDTIPGLERHLRRHGSEFEFGAPPTDGIDKLDEREIDLDVSRWDAGWEIEGVPESGIDGRAIRRIPAFGERLRGSRAEAQATLAPNSSVRPASHSVMSAARTSSS
jgi:hypothetical protein